MLPVPDAAKPPIAELLFVQLTVVPVGNTVKLGTVKAVLIQAVLILFIAEIDGLGLTVTVTICTGPGHEFAVDVGVTE